MATLQPQLKRIALAGGFALAVAAAPAFGVVTAPAPTAPLACPGGEEADPYTGSCVPHTVPNASPPAPRDAGSQFGGIPGNPDIPAVALPGGGGAIPCTGANTGECIGLAEEGAAMGPQAVPESHVGSSPTIHGHLGP